MPPISRFEDTPYGPVHVRVHESDGPTTFVAVHGLGGSSYNWDALAPMLEGTLLAVDLPGFGLSPPHPGDPFDAYLRVVADIVRGSNPPVVLIGNSMGGAIAEHVAVTVDIDGLVLIAPATPLPPGRPAGDPRVFGRLVLQGLPLSGPLYSRHLAESKTPRDQVKDLLAIVAAHPASIAPDLVTGAERLASLRRHLPWTYRAFSDALRSVAIRLVQRRTFFRTVDDVKAPTLLLYGSEDRVVSPHALRYLADRRPDWTTVELDDIGHVPMLEVPATVALTIAEWMGSRVAARAG